MSDFLRFLWGAILSYIIKSGHYSPHENFILFVYYFMKNTIESPVAFSSGTSRVYFGIICIFCIMFDREDILELLIEHPNFHKNLTKCTLLPTRFTSDLLDLAMKKWRDFVEDNIAATMTTESIAATMTEPIAASCECNSSDCNICCLRRVYPIFDLALSKNGIQVQAGTPNPDEPFLLSDQTTFTHPPEVPDNVRFYKKHPNRISNEDKITMAKEMLKSGSLLFIAIFFGRLSMAKMLIDEGAELDVPEEFLDRDKTLNKKMIPFVFWYLFKRDTLLEFIRKGFTSDFATNVHFSHLFLLAIEYHDHEFFSDLITFVYKGKLIPAVYTGGPNLYNPQHLRYYNGKHGYGSAFGIDRDCFTIIHAANWQNLEAIKYLFERHLAVPDAEAANVIKYVFNSPDGHYGVSGKNINLPSLAGAVVRQRGNDSTGKILRFLNKSGCINFYQKDLDSSSLVFQAIQGENLEALKFLFSFHSLLFTICTYRYHIISDNHKITARMFANGRILIMGKIQANFNEKLVQSIAALQIADTPKLRERINKIQEYIEDCTKSIFLLQKILCIIGFAEEWNGVGNFIRFFLGFKSYFLHPVPILAESEENFVEKRAIPHTTTQRATSVLYNTRFSRHIASFLAMGNKASIAVFK